jgi:hypothetical protein
MYYIPADNEYIVFTGSLLGWYSSPMYYSVDNGYMVYYWGVGAGVEYPCPIHYSPADKRNIVYCWGG